MDIKARLNAVERIHDEIKDYFMLSKGSRILDYTDDEWRLVIDHDYGDGVISYRCNYRKSHSISVYNLYDFDFVQYPYRAYNRYVYIILIVRIGILLFKEDMRIIYPYDKTAVIEEMNDTSQLSPNKK